MSIPKIPSLPRVPKPGLVLLLALLATHAVYASPSAELSASQLAAPQQAERAQAGTMASSQGSQTAKDNSADGAESDAADSSGIDTVDLDEIVVKATRSNKTAKDLPIKIDVFGEDEIRLQQSLTTNPTEILSNLIPSFSPSRQKLSDAGTSFRGRRPLFLIDGVPQSNPLRDGSRSGFTLDMEVVETIEVVFGANASQGLGASGGIINYITVSPPESGELEQRASLTTTINDDFDDEGFGWRAHYLLGKDTGEFDFVTSLSYESRGLMFDGNNNAIALDNTQGDIADSDSRNVFVKLGWEPDANQRLQFTANDFRLQQDGDFVSVDGDRELGIPATSVPGDPQGIVPINDVSTLSLDYSHASFLGGTFSAQLYYQDFSALFGGGTFGVFQDPAIAPVGELFDQSENNSEKIGTRMTYTRARLADLPVDAVVGFDFLRDKTFQRLALTDRNWVPITKFFNYAPFLQLDYQALDWLSISGGLRWEFATLDVPDFSSIAGNRPDFMPVQVSGGSPSFDEPLLNIGAVIEPVRGLRLYTSFAEAFSMPDVGRVLRGVSVAETNVDTLLDLQPIVTRNKEFGAAWGNSRGEIAATYFESNANFGSRLVADADGIFSVQRQATVVDGWEFSGKLYPSDWLTIAAAYSVLNGRFDSDDDGRADADLGARDIGPDRLNFSLDITPPGRFSGRIQSFTFFDESFRNAGGVQTAEFAGYTTVDAAVAADLGLATLTFSVSNLLDKQFISYFGQAATTSADDLFAGRGRTFILRADTRF